MQLADLPDTVLFDVLVLVNAFTPKGAFAQLSCHDERAPARLCRKTVCRNVHYRLEHEMFVELAASQTLASAAQGKQVLADSFLPHVDAIKADFDRALWCEEIRGLVPHSLVDVIAVGALQALQGSCIFNAVRLGLELPESSLKNDAPFAVFRSISRLPVMWSCQYPLSAARTAIAAAKKQRFH